MKISIITACFNSAATVADTLKSVSGQDYGDLEHIVVDGGSADNTLALVKEHGRRVSCAISGPDAGMYYALNKGIGLATGEIIGFLHADDVYAANDVLSKVAAAFVSMGADAVYGDLAYIKKDGSLLRYWKAGEYMPAALKNGWMPPHPAVFVRNSVYEKYGVFNTDFRIAADYELMTRFLAKYSMRISYLPQLLVKMRVGGASNRSVGNIIRKSVEDYRVIRAYGLGGMATLLKKNLSKLPQFVRRPV